MKLSVVIPTRERAEYLQSSLQSALLAADQAQVPVEIVVSDNASTDATQQVLAAITDPRIILLRTERRLSMRENFEFALSHTTGSHILFIGDDDAVLPNGLRILARLIRAHDPDIVKWRVPSYKWPDLSTGASGILKVRPHLLTGKVTMLDPHRVLASFAQGRARTYHKGGMIYHGCVSRRLIEIAMATAEGPYFRGSSPDVFTSLRAIMVTDRPMIHIALPLTLGGASPRSNGASGKKNANSGKPHQGTEYASFITESADDPWQCRLPANCLSLNMVTLDCLQSASKLHQPDLHIDLDQWSKRILQEIKGFAEPARSMSLSQANTLMGLTLQLPEASPASVTVKAVEKKPALAEKLAATRLKRGLSRLVFQGGADLEHSAGAAAFLDRLASLTQADGSDPGRFFGMLNFAKMHMGARRMLS